MKYFAIVLILISVGGSYCDLEEESCRRKIRRICGHPDPPGFPHSPEEFLSSCRDVQEIISCAYDVRETCEQDEYEMRISRSMKNFLDYLKSMCVEDNPTFKAISSNLQCIERVTKMEHDVCMDHELSDENMEIISTHMFPYIEGDRKDIRDCLFHLMDTMCESIKFGYHCGEDVKDAVSEVLSKINFRGAECTPEHLEELEPIQEAYEAILIEELLLLDTLERKRK